LKKTDLTEFDALLCEAREVRSLRDCRDAGPGVIGLRHDVDDGASMDTVLAMAAWEAQRGYRSTYYFLHTAPYWKRPGFCDVVRKVSDMGHEVGIHSNALAEALTTEDDPDWILDRALRNLRGCGVDVVGVAGHGDARCYAGNYTNVEFVNHEQFEECDGGWPRPRTVQRGKHSLIIQPRPLARFGLTYEALTVAPRAGYLSDSGGKWSADMADVCDAIAQGFVQILQHPDWWLGVYGG
jgi:hypothetical protein